MRCLGHWEGTLPRTTGISLPSFSLMEAGKVDAIMFRCEFNSRGLLIIVVAEVLKVTFDAVWSDVRCAFLDL